MKVGLTGGYATGKSFVAAEFERLGCQVISADKLGHQVLQPYGSAYAAVVKAFGPEILEDDGWINRQKLGRIVFRCQERLAELNALVHPAVFRLEEQMMQEFAAGHVRGISVVEAAILIETGRYSYFDRLVLTSCSEDLQIERAMARDNVSEDQVRARLRMQMPLAEKRAFADYIIDTGSTLLETTQQVRAVFEQLRSEA